MNFNNPQEIEKRSMEIIDNKIKNMNKFSPQEEKIVKRIVHATADPEIAEKVVVSSQAISAAFDLFEEGCNLVTDVNMLKAGISKKALNKLNIKVNCFIAREEIAEKASQLDITRSMMSMRKAVEDKNNKLFIIGNAPTALFELLRLIKAGKGDNVKLIIGTPVGFVGAAEAKENLQEFDIPYITVKGKKGGSPVAASIINALLYMYI